jgi:hypothetical protein
MKMIAKVVAAAALSVAVIAPTSAAVIVQPGASAVQPPENVQLNIDVRPGDNIVRGTTNQTNSIVLFQSSTDNLVSSPQGQARIESLDSSLGALTFGLENGSTFTSAEFNILAATGGPITLQALAAGGAVLNTITNFTVGANGENFFGLIADQSTPISSVRITATGGTQISSIGQFRLGGITSAVPEPSTWAMMLIGFGAVGYSMRRRKVGYSGMRMQAV